MSVRLVVAFRIKPGTEEALAAAYAALVAAAAQQPGLVEHQLCRALDDPERWMVTSEWETIEQSTTWDRSETHAELLGPLRACFAEASRTAFAVQDGARP
jgi:heme-degrading monooxygenase HmoA